MKEHRPLGWTTLEEAKLLAETGLDPNTADMCYLSYKDFDDKDFRFYGVNARAYKEMKRETKEFDYVPCWSLGALIGLMPKFIKKYDSELNYNTYYHFKLSEGNQIPWKYDIKYAGEKKIYATPKKDRTRMMYDSLIKFTSDNIIEISVDMIIFLFQNGYIKKHE